MLLYCIPSLITPPGDLVFIAYTTVMKDKLIPTTTNTRTAITTIRMMVIIVKGGVVFGLGVEDGK